MSWSRFFPPKWFLVVAALALASFSAAEEPRITTNTANGTILPLPMVPQIFQTRDWTGQQIDSVAVWRNGKGGGYLLVSAKYGDCVYVCDALTGAQIGAIGGRGGGLGQMLRPNGLAVIDKYLFVVERDNRRVQVFEIPSFRPLFTFGQGYLAEPYGIAVYRFQNLYVLYVTDNCFGGGGDRVKMFNLTPVNGSLNARFILSFGHPGPPGGLRQTESIVADPPLNRLYICEEIANAIHVFDLAGRFTGMVWGKGVISYAPEGLAMFGDPTAPGIGWLVVADQGRSQTALRIFRRDNGRYMGTVTGWPVLANSDGIALSPGNMGRFQRAALYCSHDDFHAQAYSWQDIENILRLRPAPKKK